MLLNDNLIREKLAASFSLAAAGPIATAAASVDIVSHVGVTATAAGLVLTLPLPTDARSGNDFRVTNTGAIAFTIGSKLIGASDYADFSFDTGTWHSEASAPIDLYRDRGMPNTLMTLSGVATFSRAKFFSWTNRFIILGGGRGPGTLSTAGYYDIGMPPVGTTILGVGGAASVTVTAAGIDMRQAGGNWTNLYYILPAGGSGTVVANFRLVTYSADLVIPDNWALVFAYNPDAFTVKLGNGQIVKEGGDSTGAVLPFDAVINFNQITPTTPGVTFTPNTPASDTVLYVSSIDGSSWTYNGTTYISQPVSADWKTTGNAATNQATNFLGTTDNVGLSIRTSNQIRQTITAAGDVGIGITVPLSRLSISGGNNEIGFYQGGLNQGKQAIIKVASPADGDGHLAFETYQGGFGGGERMRITRNGLVGINTTAPINTLHIGTPRIANTGGVRLPITSASGAQTGQPIGVDANGDIVRLAATSFDATVDFNQATPTTPGVVFTPNTPALTTVLYVSSTNGSQWTYNGSAYVAAPAQPAWQTTGNAGTVQATNFVGTTDNVGLSLRTNNQIRQTITNAGFVGIGTTTPTNRLHVPNAGFNPNANDLASIKVEGSYGGGISFAEGANRCLIWSDSGRTLNFSTGGTVAGTPERMRILNTGNVGINTTGPTEKLEVGGNIRVTGVPNFASTAAAIASALLPGVMYTVTIGGAKQLYIR